MSLRSVQLSCLALAALACGCAKKTPPTQHVQMDPEIIHILLEHGPLTAPTEPAPGPRDLMTDPEADKTSALPTTVFAVQFEGSSPPWHCFDADKGYGEVGSCQATARDCNDLRAELKESGFRVTACREQPRAACFPFEKPLKETKSWACFASFDACEGLQISWMIDPEVRNVGPCEARRLVGTWQ